MILLVKSLFTLGLLLNISAISFADYADRPTDAGFSFLGEGSVVVDFYQDRNPPTRHKDKYVVFMLKKGMFNESLGDVYTIDTVKCRGSGCWTRETMKRRKEFPSLRMYFDEKYGSAAESKWEALKADTKIILNKEYNDTISTGKDRIYFKSSGRIRNPKVMDPGKGVSYNISLVEDCGPTGSGSRWLKMMREIYDIDGVGCRYLATGNIAVGAECVSEKKRILTNVSGLMTHDYNSAISRVSGTIRDYLNQYFPNKKVLPQDLQN